MIISMLNISFLDRQSRDFMKIFVYAQTSRYCYEQSTINASSYTFLLLNVWINIIKSCRFVISHIMKNKIIQLKTKISQGEIRQNADKLGTHWNKKNELRARKEDKIRPFHRWKPMESPLIIDAANSRTGNFF